jgi:hypothetical protein
MKAELVGMGDSRAVAGGAQWWNAKTVALARARARSRIALLDNTAWTVIASVIDN